MKNVVSVVMGGGKGTRLFPLTQIRSKPAVPLGGRYRLIDIPISNCINSGLNRIFVVTQYNSESLNRHVIQTYRFGHFSQGFVDILAAEQTPESAEWYMGTADAVRRCLRHLLAYDVEYILILSGDQLYRMDFSQVLQSHKERNADLSICVIPVEREKAASFGIMKMADDGRLLEFHEKPEDDALVSDLEVDVERWKDSGVTPERTLLASMGIYVFNASVLRDLLADPSRLDFGQHVIPASLSRYRVFGHLFDGYWEDIGTIGAFYQANLDLTVRYPQFNFFHPDAPIYTRPRFLPASRIRDCRIKESVVAEGCSLFDSEIRESVIGVRSRIHSSRIAQTLMMGADFYEEDDDRRIPLGIGAGADIRRAIVDKNARIGRDVQVSNKEERRDYDGDNFYIRDGIVIIPKNAEIPDGTRI